MAPTIADPEGVVVAPTGPTHGAPIFPFTVAYVTASTSSMAPPAQDESMAISDDDSPLSRTTRAQAAQVPGITENATALASRYQELTSEILQQRSLDSMDVCANYHCGKALPEHVFLCTRCEEQRYCSAKCRLRNLVGHVVPDRCKWPEISEKTLARRKNMLAVIIEILKWLANGTDRCCNPACNLLIADGAATCARCQDSRYCSTICHVLDWPRHITTCRLFPGADAASAERITAMELWACRSYVRLTMYLVEVETLDGDDEMERIMNEIEREGAKISEIRANRISDNSGGGGAFSANSAAVPAPKTT